LGRVRSYRSYTAHTRRSPLGSPLGCGRTM
jgi:hypothetical protein